MADFKGNNNQKMWEAMGVTNFGTAQETSPNANRANATNAYTRALGLPLDLSSVHASYEDAVVYAATKGIAYQDQLIVAEGVAYVIVTESQGKVTISSYRDSITGKLVEGEATEYDIFLKRVGIVPTGDNASISVNAEGLVKMFGFDGAQTGTVGVKEDGKIVWKTLEEIGAGDGNDNTTYTFFPIPEEYENEVVGFGVQEYFNGVENGEPIGIELNTYTKSQTDEKIAGVLKAAPGVPFATDDPNTILICETTKYRLWTNSETPQEKYIPSAATLYAVTVPAGALDDDGMGDLVGVDFFETAQYGFAYVYISGQNGKSYTYSSGKWSEFGIESIQEFTTYGELLTAGQGAQRIQKLSTNPEALTHACIGEGVFAPLSHQNDMAELNAFIKFASTLVQGVDTDDKILALDANNVLSATVSIGYNEADKSIVLYGKNNTILGFVDATPFIKDGMLHDVDYNPETNELTFTWNTDEGSKTDTVDLTDLVDPYTAGNGLQLTGNEFAVKLDTASESFLTVGANGVKLAGVQSAIDTAKQGAITAAASDATSKANQAKADAIADAEGKIATAKSEAATDATNKANQAKADAIADAATKYATKTYVGTIPTVEDAEGNNKYEGLDVIGYVNKKAEETLAAASGNSTETAASVKQQLDDYKGVVNPKLKAIQEEVWGSETTEGTSRIDTIENKLSGIEAGAQVNVIETIKVNGAAQTVTDKAVDIKVPTKLSELTDDIAHVDDVIVKAKQTSGEGAVTYESKLKVTRTGDTITLDDSALQNAINEVNNNTVHSISVNDTPIDADSEHHVNITAATGSQNGTIAIAGQDVAVKGLGSMAYKTATDYKPVQTAVADPTATANTGATLTYVDTISQDKDGVITATKKTYDLQTNVLTPIANNKTAIETLAGEGNTSTVKKNADDIKALAGEGNNTTVKANADAIKALAGEGNTSTVKANADAISKLVGSDTNKSARTIATEVLAGALEGAHEDFDTLIEMAEWLDSHSADAIEMGNDIKDLQEQVDIGETTVTAYVAAEIAKIPTYDLPAATKEKLGGVKLDDKTIKMDADNRIYVAEVSTDVLVMGTKTLVLNGGSSEAN